MKTHRVAGCMCFLALMVIFGCAEPTGPQKTPTSSSSQASESTNVTASAPTATSTPANADLQAALQILDKPRVTKPPSSAQSEPLFALPGSNGKPYLLDANGNIEKIQLAHVDINDNDVALLVKNPTITELTLVDTDITDASVGKIVQLPNLQGLNLSNTKITDAAIPQLKTLTKLQTLSLAGTQITDESVPVLAEMQHLRVLNIYFCPHLSADAKKQIQSSLPNCKVNVGN